MYVGLDVHSETSFCVILDQDGEIVAERNLNNDPFEFADFFDGVLADFDGPVEAAMEATTDAYFVQVILDDLGIPVRLAHPRKLRLIAESSVMTDARAAFILADFLRMGSLPLAYLAPAEVMQSRELSRGRQSLVVSSTRYKNKVSAMLHRQGLKCPVKDTFSKAGREWLAGLELPMISDMMLRIYLKVIDMLGEFIAECNAMLRQLAEHDERIQRLQQIPGIGEVFGPMIIAEVGDIQRFWDKTKFVAYCGLAPTVHQSAKTTHRGSLRQDCNHWLRFAFIEAAQSCGRHPGPYQDYYQRKLEERDSKVAKVATARRLCRLVFAMLHSGEDYRADYQAA